MKMGIRNLNEVLAERSPGSITEKLFKHQGGRTVAIDAPIALYRYLIESQIKVTHVHVAVFVCRPKKVLVL